MGDKSKLKIGTYQNPNSGRSKESIDRYVRGMREKKYGGKRINTDRIRKFKTGMTPGQAKLAAKAPPPNKIDEKDFAVLRAEKAKGRGMGLQDEKVQPGKVMKANLGILAMKKAKDKGAKGAEFLSPIAMAKRMFNKKSGGVIKARVGKSIKKDPTKTVNPFEKKSSKFMERRKKLAAVKSLAGKVGRLGAIGAAVLTAGAGAAKLGQTIGRKMSEKKDKKMGGGMIKKYSSGGESTYTKGYEGRKTGKGVRESLKDKVTPMKKERLLEGLKASGKMGGGMMKKYSEGMTLADMKPYGGKYAKIKKDMRDTASENVKRLTTQSDAYDPETRYVTAEQRKGNSRRRKVKKTTDQVYLKGVANKMKEDMGSNTRTSILTPSQARERRIIRPKRMAGRMGGGMMQKPMGYRTGIMVKARGCKLGRTKPTKIT